MTTKSWLIAVFLLALVAACAQEDSAVISGTTYDPEGESIPYLWVRATEVTSGNRERAEGTVEGDYEISGLAAGTYTLEVNPPCCVFAPYESDPVEVSAAQTVDIDIHLDLQGLNTVGDDPGLLLAGMRSEIDVPDAPPPRTAWGAPDVSGMWLIGDDPFPEKPQAHEWAQELFEERLANNVIDAPLAKCLPGDAPVRLLVKIVQKPDLIVFLFESYPGFRQVFMDGRDHPEYPNPAWMGHSIGHWEGDTLVVDTIGFNDRGWMKVYPRSEELHIVERFTRTRLGRMDHEVTIEDPKVFKAPWVRNNPAYLAPQEDVLEYVCENNKW